MNCTQIQELAAAHALGTLEPAEAAKLEAFAAADPDVRAELATFLTVAGRLVHGLAPVPPPPALREKVLARIARTPQVNRPDAPPTEAVPEGFRFLRPSDGPWLEGPAPGVRLQVLSTDWRRNLMMFYLDLSPGARYPDHTHGAPEQLFVISGNLATGGRLLKAGDFVEGAAGTHHGDVVSPGGCQALLVTAASSALAEYARSRLRLAGERLAGLLRPDRGP